MRANYQVLFYLKKPKTWNKGSIPIYMRITLRGVQKEISVGRKCEPERWCSKSNREKGTKESTRLLNIYLTELERKVEEAHTVLTKERKTITVETLKNKFLGVEEKKPSIIALFEGNNQHIKELIGTDYEASTLKTYNTTLGHLKEYVPKIYGTEDLTVDLLDYNFIMGFDHFLKTKGGIQPISAKKYITHLKQVVNNYCIKPKLISFNPFLDYKNKAKVKEKEFLTQEQLDRIIHKEINVERVDRVRDIFLFCCFTGLSYSDVKKLKRAEIMIGVDGDQWIFTNRKKTATNSRIPLLSPALAIIDKYKDHPQCEVDLLPVLSNQRMNSYLKEVADLCGISQNLTFHLSRHTFATTVTLTNGVPIESVSKMLGHTNIKTTQHYAKIIDKKVGQDMAELKRKYSML